MLNEKRVKGWPEYSARSLTLPDPVGAEFESRVLPNGLRLEPSPHPHRRAQGSSMKTRPNVTIEIATLALKTSNAVILRGGRRNAAQQFGLDPRDPRRIEANGHPKRRHSIHRQPRPQPVTQLLRLDQYVDMIIPPWGAALHKLCHEQSTIPVITGGIGVCHLYVDEALIRALD